MMIPTISIDVVSMPVTRDGTNLLSNMPLGEVASQVLEQGAALEAAVEQFQQIMAEFQPTEIAEAALMPLQTEEEGSDKSVASPVASSTPAVIGEAAPMPLQAEVVGSDKSAASPVVSSMPVEIGEAAPMPLQAEVEGSDKSVASPNVPLVETSPAAPMSGTSFAASTVETASATEPGTSPMSVVSNTSAEIGEAAPMPLQAEVLGSDKSVASPNVPLVETSPAAPITGTSPAAPTAETAPAFERGTSSVSVVANTPTEIGDAALMPLQEGVKGSDKRVASPNVPLAETSPAAPIAGTSPAAPSVETVPATELGTSPMSVVSNAPTKIGEAAPTPLQTEQVVSDKRVFSPNEPSIEATPLDVEEPPDVPVLHAAPVVASAQPQVIDVKDVAVESVQVVAARVVHQVVATPAQVLIEAASAVADTIVVSPGLLRGAGEVQVQLRPDVLEGTVIQISTTASGSLTVQFAPVTENMAELLEKCAPQLVTYLSERIHSVQIAVNVKRDEKLKG